MTPVRKQLFYGEANVVFLSLFLALPSFSPFLFHPAMSGKIRQEEDAESGPCVQVDSIQMEFMCHLTFIL